MAVKKLLFENKVCSRCGGTGHYSFNLMHGTTCYGCSGAGYKLTPRGRAAQAYLDALRVKPASEVKVGDLIWIDPFYTKARFARVLKVGDAPPQTSKKMVNGEWVTEEHPQLVIESEGLTQHVSPDSKIRMGFDAEIKAAHRAAALAYQDTLTATGKPKKVTA